MTNCIRNASACSTIDNFVKASNFVDQAIFFLSFFVLKILSAFEEPRRRRAGDLNHTVVVSFDVVVVAEEEEEEVDLVSPLPLLLLPFSFLV